VEATKHKDRSLMKHQCELVREKRGGTDITEDFKK
jgi:hypothetical protein